MRRYQCVAVWQYLLSLAEVQWSMVQAREIINFERKRAREERESVSAERMTFYLL